MILRLPSTTDDAVFGNLSPADLIRYSRASKKTYQVVSSYMRRVFNINKLLGRYFTEQEISSFRFWQYRTGMLISGSTALQFFDRTSYPESDLDIYVEHRYCEAIAFWLASIGYAYAPRPDSEQVQSLEETLYMSKSVVYKTTKFLPPTMEYFHTGVADVYNFRKSNPDRKIQLITSRFSPLDLILKFHSTCVMNLISHEKAYSLYPRATFEERRSLVFPEYSTKAAAGLARKKYISRGWEFVDKLTPDEIMDYTSAFAAGSRYVGDSTCWTIPVLPHLLSLPEGFIETNSWNLKYGAAYKAELSFRVLVSPTLRYSYLIQDVHYLQHYISHELVTFTDEENYSDEDIRDFMKFYRKSILDI